jgi:hypothetical protein
MRGREAEQEAQLLPSKTTEVGRSPTWLPLRAFRAGINIDKSSLLTWRTSGDLQDQLLPTCINDDAIDEVQMICQVRGRIDQPARHLSADKGYAWLTPP